MTITALPRVVQSPAVGTNEHRAAIIRRARLARSWTQADLARLAGYSQPTVSRLETGRGRITDTAVLGHLADILDISPAALGIATTPVAELVGCYRTGIPDLGQLLITLVAAARRRIDIMGDFALPQQIHALPRHLADRATVGVTVRVICPDPGSATTPVDAARARALLDAHTATGPAYRLGVYYGTLTTAIARIDSNLLVRTTIDGLIGHPPVLHLQPTPGGTLTGPYLHSLDTIWAASTAAAPIVAGLKAVA